MTLVVDAHTHVWRAVPDHPEPAATIVSPASDVPPSLLADWMEEAGVARAVVVQPICAGTDNEYVVGLAAAAPDRHAAVCVVDPASPAAATELERWAARGARGVRLRPLLPAEADVLESAAGRVLWEAAGRLGLVVSILGGPACLRALRARAEEFSDVPVVLDHAGYPDLGRGAAELLDLAGAPSVHVKVSGFHYFSSEPYPYRDSLPLLRELHRAFGARRLLWGSDFPHVLLRCGYRRSRLLGDTLLDFLDDAELAEVMGGTASRLYWRDPDGSMS